MAIQGEGTQILNGGGYALTADGSKLASSLNILYGPYASVEEAHSSIIAYMQGTLGMTRGTAKKIANGLVVGITQADGTIKDYQYSGTMPADGYTASNIVEKVSGSSNSDDDEEEKVYPTANQTIEEIIQAKLADGNGTSTRDLFLKNFYNYSPRGFASQLVSLNTNGNTKNAIATGIQKQTSDRIKIGAVYAPKASDVENKTIGCEYAYIELENTYSDFNFPLYGCELHIKIDSNADYVIKFDDKKYVIGSGSTFLIRGKKYESDQDIYVKVDTYDIDDSNLDLSYSNGIAFALIYNPSDIEEDVEVDSIKKSLSVSFGISTPLVVANGGSTNYTLFDGTKESGTTAITDKSTFPYLYMRQTIDTMMIGSITDLSWTASTKWISYSNTICKNAFELDPAQQAYQSANTKDSSRARNNKLRSATANGTDDYYIHLAKSYIEFPHSLDSFDVDKFTPKASYEGKNVCTDKTQFDTTKPNMVTCSFGINIYTTRCFNWVSEGVHDEFVWVRKQGEKTWSKRFESYKKGESGTNASKSGLYKKMFSSVANDNIYARISNVFPACNIEYTSHKVVLNIVDEAVSEPTVYEYCVGRKDEKGRPSEYVSDVMTFTLYPSTYTPKVYQTTDQQGFHWVEYQVWAASAEQLNQAIARDQKNANIIPILLNSGDMTQNGTRINEWLDYYNAGISLFNHIEQMNVVGNNDLANTDVTVLGTGDDEGKSNPYFFHLFYTYEIDETVCLPVIYSNKEGMTDTCKYVPSLYYFDFKNGETPYRMLMLNSELTVATCQKWFNLVPSSTGEYDDNGTTLNYNTTINAYTGYDIASSAVTSDKIGYNKIEGKPWVYDMIYQMIAQASEGTKFIACCHEMPFTVITTENIQDTKIAETNLANFTSSRSNSSNKLVGSHMNQMNAYDLKGLCWFSRMLEAFDVKLCIGGHKHTYMATYPICEYYAYKKDGNYYTSMPKDSQINGDDNWYGENEGVFVQAFETEKDASATYYTRTVSTSVDAFSTYTEDNTNGTYRKCTPNGSMPMGATLESDDVTFIWDDWILESKDYKKSFKVNVDHSKFPIKTFDGEVTDENKVSAKNFGGSDDFADKCLFSVITTTDKEVSNGVTYVMSQATGYKQTSNKELPSLKQAYAMLIPATSWDSTKAKATANNNQKYPIYVELEFVDDNVKVVMKRYCNIMTTTQTKGVDGVDFGSGKTFGAFTNDYYNEDAVKVQSIYSENSDIASATDWRYGDWKDDENGVVKTINY